MRVAVLSYPMLFQSAGGLRMKIGRTVDALQKADIDARLIDPVRERLTDFDLVHVFAAYNGNQRIVQQAKADGLPVVLSTILNPPFTAWEGRRARFLNRLVGRLTHWEVTTSYWQTHTALDAADHLVALGAIERDMLVQSYLVPDAKVSIIHNGVGEEFFGATPDAFRAAYPQVPERFVLHTGLVGDVKNQKGLVQALQGTGLPVVLIGGVATGQQEVLQATLEAGGSQVHWLGELPHGPLIASACAASSVVAIPSKHEGMPNSILEALAADRPVVLTDNHTIDLPLPPAVARQVPWNDPAAIRQAVTDLWERPPAAGAARAVVAELSWAAVAQRLLAIYRSLRPTAA